jgi:hypothetical protein
MSYAGLARFLVKAYSEGEFRANLQSLARHGSSRSLIDSEDQQFLEAIRPGEVERTSKALIDKWGHLARRAYPHAFSTNRQIANDAVGDFFSIPRLISGARVEVGMDQFGRFLEMMLFSLAEHGPSAADHARLERLTYAAVYGPQVQLSLASSLESSGGRPHDGTRVKLHPRSCLAAFRTDVVSAESQVPTELTFLAVRSNGFGAAPTVVKVSSLMADILYFIQSQKTVGDLIDEFDLAAGREDFIDTIIQMAEIGVLDIAF